MHEKQNQIVVSLVYFLEQSFPRQPIIKVSIIPEESGTILQEFFKGIPYKKIPTEELTRYGRISISTNGEVKVFGEVVTTPDGTYLESEVDKYGWILPGGNKYNGQIKRRSFEFSLRYRDERNLASVLRNMGLSNIVVVGSQDIDDEGYLKPSIKKTLDSYVKQDSLKGLVLHYLNTTKQILQHYLTIPFSSK